MSMTQGEFRFPENITLDGERYALVYDPGNPSRAQVLPNYKAMFVQPTSACEPVELQGLGKKWLAVLDTVIPAMTAQQTGGRPVPEKRYLCFILLDYQRDPMAILPQEMVMYGKIVADEKAYGLSRGRRILDAVLGSASAEAPKPNANWTKQLAVLQEQQAPTSVTPEEAETHADD